MKSSHLLSLIAILCAAPAWGQTDFSPADMKAQGQNGPVATKLGYSDEVAKQLFSLFSDKDKQVQLTSIGGRADQEVANRYQRYLEKEGFKVLRVEVESRPSVVRKIEIRNTPGGYLVQIAPSAAG